MLFVKKYHVFETKNEKYKENHRARIEKTYRLQNEKERRRYQRKSKKKRKRINSSKPEKDKIIVHFRDPLK